MRRSTPRRTETAGSSSRGRLALASALAVLATAALVGTGCKKGTKTVSKTEPKSALTSALKSAPKSTPKSALKSALKDLRPLTPDDVLGWTARDQGRHYDPDSVFDLLNGGAEIYLDYKLERLLYKEYERPGRPRLTVHLFAMATSADAWGIFSHEREGKPVDIGQEADYEGGLLRFWRGRYFASLQATRETGPVREALFALARDIVARIPQAGKRPDLVELLSKEGQRPGSLRYVHTWPALDHHLRLGPDNPLGLTRATAVALAAYGDGSPLLHGLVVRYAETGAAQRAAAALTSRKEAPLAMASVCGPLLVAAIGGADAQTRTALLARLGAAACKK